MFCCRIDCNCWLCVLRMCVFCGKPRLARFFLLSPSHAMYVLPILLPSSSSPSSYRYHYSDIECWWWRYVTVDISYWNLHVFVMSETDRVHTPCACCSVYWQLYYHRCHIWAIAISIDVNSAKYRRKVLPLVKWEWSIFLFIFFQFNYCRQICLRLDRVGDSVMCCCFCMDTLYTSTTWKHFPVLER